MPKYRLQFLDEYQKQLGRSEYLTAVNLEWAAAQASRYTIPIKTAFLRVENTNLGPADSLLRPFP